jgi:hypothetical protein
MINAKGKMMKIKSIKLVGKLPVYDISVADNQQYVLENGIVSHNTGSYYGADNIWIIGRQQEKEDKDVVGYHFIINIEKSRYVKEKSKIPITVSYNCGINRWSGLLELAIEGGYVVKPKNGWYAIVDKTTGEIGPNMRASDIVDNAKIWKNIFSTTDFPEWLKNKYTLAMNKIMEEDDESE